MASVQHVGSKHPREAEKPDADGKHAEKLRGNLRPNRMGEAIAAGRWGSYLTFSWAGSFLSLGSTVTIKEEHLEGTYEKHERYCREGLIICVKGVLSRCERRIGSPTTHDGITLRL